MNERNTNEWVEKLDGARMNALESAELDELLNSPSQQSMRQAVQALPQDSVSMQWRSTLNEKVRTLRPLRKKATLLVIGFRALAGVGLASVVCIALYSKFSAQPPAPKVKAQNVASALIAEHRESVASSEIAGPGIVGTETDGRTGSESSESGNADLDTL